MKNTAHTRFGEPRRLDHLQGDGQFASSSGGRLYRNSDGIPCESLCYRRLGQSATLVEVVPGDPAFLDGEAQRERALERLSRRANGPDTCPIRMASAPRVRSVRNGHALDWPKYSRGAYGRDQAKAER